MGECVEGIVWCPGPSGPFIPGEKWGGKCRVCGHISAYDQWQCCRPRCTTDAVFWVESESRSDEISLYCDEHVTLIQKLWGDHADIIPLEEKLPEGIYERVQRGLTDFQRGYCANCEQPSAAVAVGRDCPNCGSSECVWS